MELIYKELSEKIIGACFRVYNTLGFGYNEKEYQKALAAEFLKLELNFSRELYSSLLYEGVKIRGYFIDFVVNEKIVVELKVANKVYQKHYSQTHQYLKNNSLQLGLIVVYSPTGVIVKRVVNLQ
jgi:GxxExxY protein